jgi:glutamate-1-semialdehyde 2,1-aminomutase
MNGGIPEQDAITFPYGDLHGLEVLLDQHEVACVIMEAAAQTGRRIRCRRAGRSRRK